MTLALWVELLYAGLVQGFMRGMERDLLDLEVGDLQIHAPDYRNDPSLFTKIDDSKRLLRTLDEAGFPAAPRLLAGGLAASGESSAGVALRGIDLDRDARVSLIGERVAEGSWLNATDPHGVVVGRRLAKILAVHPGDELVVLTQAADGSMANDLFTVRGVLLGVAEGTDRAAVFMTEAAFRELLVFPEGAHEIIVRRPPQMPLEEAAIRVRRLAPELEVLTWRELMPLIANMLDSSRGLMLVVFFIVYVAVGILILNAMLMAVFERIRELGVLKALGVEPHRVLGMIYLESAVQAALAILVGGALAIPGMWYLATFGIHVGKLSGTNTLGIAMRPIWYGAYDSATVTGPLIMLLFIVAAAALYPALKAAWIRPVEAMRHQ